jgi:hypothetical protein
MLPREPIERRHEGQNLWGAAQRSRSAHSGYEPGTGDTEATLTIG